MRSIRSSWHEPRRPDDPASHLHLLSRTAPPRPRWGVLYVAFAVITLAGTAAHFLASGSGLLRVVDAGFGFALFVTLAAWVHLNRVALAQSDDLDARALQPRMRIVRGRARSAEETFADDGVLQLEPEERIILPYDFK